MRHLNKRQYSCSQTYLHESFDKLLCPFSSRMKEWWNKKLVSHETLCLLGSGRVSHLSGDVCEWLRLALWPIDRLEGGGSKAPSHTNDSLALPFRRSSSEINFVYTWVIQIYKKKSCTKMGWLEKDLGLSDSLIIRHFVWISKSFHIELTDWSPHAQ